MFGSSTDCWSLWSHVLLSCSTAPLQDYNALVPDYLVFPKVEYTPLGEVAVGHALNSKLTAPTALVLFVEFHFR